MNAQILKMRQPSLDPDELQPSLALPVSGGCVTSSAILVVVVGLPWQHCVFLNTSLPCKSECTLSPWHKSAFFYCLMFYILSGSCRQYLVWVILHLLTIWQQGHPKSLLFLILHDQCGAMSMSDWGNWCGKKEGFASSFPCFQQFTPSMPTVNCFKCYRRIDPSLCTQFTISFHEEST